MAAENPLKSRRGLIQIKPTNSGSDFAATATTTTTPTTPQRKKGKNVLESSLKMTPSEIHRFLNQTQNVANNSNWDTGGSLLNTLRCDASYIGSEQNSIIDAAPSEKLQLQTLHKRRTDVLFTQFLEVLQGRTNETEIFDSIQDLVQTCHGVLEDTEKDIRRGFETKKQTMSVFWLEQELKTWKLLYALYKDRIVVQGGMTVDMDCDMPPLGASEKEIVSQLFITNSLLREYQLVVDWLESCYENRENVVHIAHATSQTTAWENTLFQLKNGTQIAFSTGNEIVKSLDPDAPIREKRPLHALDEEDNLRLNRYIFGEIRQGNIENAIGTCKDFGQTWRAAILEGWRLHEDPNYDSPQQNINHKLPIEGNPRRDLWKKMSWLMADSIKYDEYTRAISGVFCGHLGALKSLLHNSWEDLLWAYLRVQIDIRVESEIRSNCMKPYQTLPDTYWNSKMSLDQIFDELSVHSDAAVRDFANSKMAIVQKYLILDDISELLLQMRRWVDEACDEGENNSLSAHFLRFLTHIVLFMRQIGRVEHQDTADRIIAAYVERLIKLNDAQLVAFYTASLPSKLQILLYSKFLESVKETEERAVALQEGISAGLDIENITRHTVEIIRQRTSTESDSSIMISKNIVGANQMQELQEGIISNFDKQKIQALEWLTFLPAHRAELLWQANAMVRTYLGENKPDCVRLILELIPDDTIGHIVNTFGNTESLPSREECSIKEHLSYKIYLIAIDHFDEWLRLFHNRPKEPQLIQSSTTFTERIASEHKEQRHRAEVEQWSRNLNDKTKIACDALYNVLLFPEKGWLIDPEIQKNPLGISKTDWENRQLQMEKIRSICIPEIVLLIHKVMHLSGDYAGCVRLADEIANERRQLLKTYTKHKLGELMAKIAESSLELLNAKLDPWGFPVTI